MVWYKELGYKRNPVESDPLKTQEEPYGYDEAIERLLYLVEAESAVLIEGPDGSGKSLLMRQVIDRFGGRGSVIYVDGERVNKRMDVSEILMGNQGALRKMLKKRPKGMILLLDNAPALPRKSYELLQYYFDQGYLKSIVFATNDRNKLQMPGSLVDRIGSRVIKTEPLTMEQAVELVLERLNQDLLSKDKLEKIYIISDKNMRMFLSNVEKVLEYIVEEDLDDIEFKTIAKVLDAQEPQEEDIEDDEEDPMICQECGEMLVQVGDHYRCEYCDLYCPVCGVLIEVDDYECPSCGVEFEDDEDE